MTENSNPSESSSRLKRVPWRKFAHALGLLILIAVVLPFVIYAVPQVVGGSQGYVVLSGSMEPVMSPGDVVIIEDVPAEQIEKGDVITFGGGGGSTPTTHRVIGVTEQDGTLAFETKGDANEDADSARVAPGDIQGKVMSVSGYLFVIPLIGYVIRFAGTQTGFFALFAIPVALFVLNEIWNVIASSRTNSGAETGDASGTAAASPDAASVPDEGSDVAVADPEASEVEAADTATTEDESAGLTFTAAELQLGVIALAAFFAYSAWVAYQTTETWAFGVAGGVGSAFLLLGGLYLVGGGGGDDDPGTSATGANGETPTVDVDREMDIVTEDTQPPGRTTLEDGQTVDSGPVEFARGIDTGDSPAASGGDAAGGESDD